MKTALADLITAQSAMAGLTIGVQIQNSRQCNPWIVHHSQFTTEYINTQRKKNYHYTKEK